MKLLLLTYKNWPLLKNLIKNDFRNRYLGNHLGIIWAFINPLIMTAVYWFVFTHGLKVPITQQAPFILWLLAGLVPWFLLNDAINSASNAVVSQNFLVKKMVFEVKLLPIVKIGSSLLVSLFFWGVLLVVSICYNYYPHLIWFQLLYYVGCSVMLCLALGFFLAGVMPFIPDISQVVTICMQIFFWITPVLWSQSLLPQSLKWIYLLNPFAYIIIGTRETLVGNTFLWEHCQSLLFFWGITLSLYALGIYTFNKLRPHFADVL